jgi:formylmethanofuran dehydrogenase subunit E
MAVLMPKGPGRLPGFARAYNGAVRLGLAALLVVLACHDRHPPRGALAEVAAIHGTAGPFVVAGYRMGERALRELGLPRGSFDLEVVHESPAQIQWSCIADGLQAATGTSAGKLNLKLVEVSPGHTTSTVRNRRTGKALHFTLTPEFLHRFLDLPRDRLEQAGGEVLRLADDQIFQIFQISQVSGG